ncbi:MAG: outer membrane protein assembly factor BamA [Chlamydiales bacterium]|nr:outer membrane protein assembly factor BamA [Chlamydiales bacterium]
MTKYFSSFLLLSLIFLSCRLFGAEPIVCPPVCVAKMDIVIKKATPHSSVDAGNLVKQLKTREGAPFSQVDFDCDLKMLANECDHVIPHLEFKEGKAYIILDIYPKLVIRSITWKGNDTVKTKRLQKELEIQPHTPFDRHAFNEAFNKLRAYYIRKGYFEAELDYCIFEDVCTNEVDIEICIREGQAGHISCIKFEGLDECEERRILNLMVTKEYCCFTSWYTKTGTFHPEALEHDKLIITNFLQNEGYSDARVEICASEANVKDRIIVKIIAYKGERYYFGNITFCGNHILSDEMVQKHFNAHPGEPFSPDKLREASQCLTLYYGSKGYIETYVNFIPKLCEHKNAYDVHFEIEEGQQYRVGLVKVFGNTHTKTSVILHESLMIPGEIFNSRKLEGTECRLKKIGYFECVNVYPVKSQHDSDEGCNRYRDVHIEVKESCTGSFGVFFGFSTIDSLFGGIEITERNFNHEGIFNALTKGANALRGNGEFLQLRTSIGIKTSSYLLRWTKPYFMDTKWIVGFDVEHTENRGITEDYSVKSTGVKLHATYSINDFLRYGWNYRLQNSYTTVNGNPTPEQRQEESSHGMISAIGPTITYDSTDCPHKPTRGFRSELDLEFAGLGGDFRFASMSYINSYYFSVSSKGTFKTRCDLQFIDPFGRTNADNLPMGERLYLGGEVTVRGYRGYSIGPQFTTSDPKGGISSLLISEEYLHRIFSRVDAFAFFDGGAVSDRRFYIDTLRFSYGLGLRIEVMENTPIIVGMGWPINPQYRADVRRFFISFGGRF